MNIVLTREELKELLKNEDKIKLSFYILKEHTSFTIIDHFFMFITFSYSRIKSIQKHVSDLKTEYKEIRNFSQFDFGNNSISISPNLYKILKSDRDYIDINGYNVCIYK
jgi:hypothetical protein